MRMLFSAEKRLPNCHFFKYQLLVLRRGSVPDSPDSKVILVCHLGFYHWHNSEAYHIVHVPISSSCHFLLVPSPPLFFVALLRLQLPCRMEVWKCGDPAKREAQTEYFPFEWLKMNRSGWNGAELCLLNQTLFNHLYAVYCWTQRGGRSRRWHQVSKRVLICQRLLIRPKHLFIFFPPNASGPCSNRWQ